MSKDHDKQKEEERKKDDERMTPEEKERLERQKELERKEQERRKQEQKEQGTSGELTEEQKAAYLALNRLREATRTGTEEHIKYLAEKKQREAEEAYRKALERGESIRNQMRRSARVTLSISHEGFSQCNIFDAMSHNRTKPEPFPLQNGMCRGLSLLWLSDRNNRNKTFKSVVEGASSTDRPRVAENIKKISDLHLSSDEKFANERGLLHDPATDVWSSVVKLVGAKGVHLRRFLEKPGYYLFSTSGRGEHVMAAHTDRMGITRFFDPNGGVVSGILGLGLFFENFLLSPLINSLYSGDTGLLKVIRLREPPKKKPEKKPEKKP